MLTIIFSGAFYPKEMKKMIKIAVIHGQSHKGSTYNIAKQLIHKISATGTEIDEYFMPTDTPDYCIGCYTCFDENEQACPHADKVQVIAKSIEAADLLIFTSPTYCYGMTGQMKTLLDHFGYMWLSHRPRPAMFNKLGIVISTASGAGASKVTKTLAQQMFWLGISNVFRYHKNVNAASWETVPDKIKQAIDQETSAIAQKIKSKIGHASPSLKLKFMFMIMRMMQKKNDWNMTDHNYWQDQGWLANKRPW